MVSYNFVNDTQMTDNKPVNNPERRLWRAVLNQALEDGFGMYTTFMCHYEKIDAELFIRNRSKTFNDICERADIDADRAWNMIQRFKLIKSGIVKPDTKKDQYALSVFNRIKDGRKRMRSSRRVANGYINGR